MAITNEKIAQLFEELGALHEMNGDSVFQIRAYQRAARTIGHLSFPLAQAVEDGADLKKIPGIGRAISDKILELLQTGRVSTYDRLVEELPDGVMTLMNIPGIGPKTAMLIAQELGVGTLEGVEQAAQDGRIAALPRMGQKATENILHHVQSLRTKDQRTPIGQALPLAEEIIGKLRQKCPDITHLFPAGSLRRWEETIGDIDLVGVSSRPGDAADALVSLEMVQEVVAHGPKKTSVVVEPGIQVDLRLGDENSFGAMLQYFTGSQQHNIRLRDYAKRQGLSLNEYGITDLATGVTEVFPNEAAFYARLGLPSIPPELRAGMWEMEAALERRLPSLVEETHLRGDLHLHSDWSDGRDPIETMVASAAALGYEYMALTDHSSGRGIANGLSDERLHRQIALLRSLQGEYSMTILCGSEVDIRADGTLDYPDELLEQLDVVVASVHSAMGQDSETMTRRIIRAMEHPSVTIIGHLSTRLLGRRKPVEFDLEAILRAARETGTVLEINASPERLDLKDTHAYRARELAVPLVIDTDSHQFAHLNRRRFGVAVARRAWCEPRHILNTMPLDQFLNFIRTPKPARTKVFDARLAEAG
ncbi:MAG: DNA polymerase/3'-5' exonuclease PolX [Dehalococcoidia bacterium]|nr:DNA polymerase/3'-5' exonuclease PolX [Dehalococcoidia bacterium]MDP7084768.1 DNA polymerase/3'-5' exonuclease PolX [Dehalococcoidia bacterium]MDP7201549.1 DNA polymerase/3'-5' exonuclease PolX [Dehalococcoidia bacterium]HJN87537.1 DNA polymerase/3'-5' exonuclease PolX [Dehalococcoidia bacterium]